MPLKARSINEIPSLTGIRGVAAVVVMLGHAELWSEAQARFFPAQVAVDLFFVLSGFVIALTYLGDGGRRAPDWMDYARARFARIYPLHLATAALLGGAGTFLALQAGRPLPSATFNFGQVVQELLLITPLPIVGSDIVWNAPSWSIGIEWWVYFTVFPLLAMAGRRLPPGVAALLALAALAAIAVWLSFAPDERVTRGWPALARGAAGFTAGWAAWRLTVAPNRWTPPAWLAAVLAIIVTACAFLWTLSDRPPPWFCLPLLPILIWALATAPGRIGALLGTGPLLWLGDISYAIYMLHVPVLLVMGRVGGKGPELGPTWLWMLICVAVTLVLGQLSYSLFERPAQRLLRGVGKRRAQSTPL